MGRRSRGWCKTVRLHPFRIHRRELSPFLKAYLYMIGKFFLVDKMHFVLQKDLTGSLWALSAKTRKAVSGTGMWAQALLSGQSRGSDSCGEDEAGKLSPEPRSHPAGPPGMCGGLQWQLYPWPGLRGCPILSLCGWVGMRRRDLGGFRKGTAREAAAERGPGAGCDTPFGG